VSVIFAKGSGRVRPTVYALEIKKSIYQLFTPEWDGQSQNEPNPQFLLGSCEKFFELSNKKNNNNFPLFSGSSLIFCNLNKKN
jgi:hypothetical protein